MVFWAGDGFSGCSPKLVGRTLYGCHPKRAHDKIEALLADLKSGKKDEVDTVERGKDGAERIIYTALRDAAGGAYRRSARDRGADRRSGRNGRPAPVE